MADGGTLTSSSSRDTWQQELSKHSVDQDTSAQGNLIKSNPFTHDTLII